MLSVASRNKILTLIFILFVSLVASLFSKSLGQEHMALGDYPGVHSDKSNNVPREVIETSGPKNIESKNIESKNNDDTPMKPSTYGNLSQGWSGFGQDIRTGSSSSGSGSGK